MTPLLAIERAVRIALEEDFGRGDVTTDACIEPDTEGRARFVARTELVLCGLAVIREVYRQVDPGVCVDAEASDGDLLARGTVAARVTGRAASLLAGERIALNFAQRLSGTATMTQRFVRALPDGSKTRIVDTRKTTPGLRALERWAVRCGGGHNHREDLSSAVLIKDNHIAAAGGVRAAIERAKKHAPHTSRIECEVDSMEQLGEALAAGAEIVLLDNFDDATLEDAVRTIAGRAIVEVSGGVTLDRIPKIAAAGVDVISAGALTHSAPAADLALDWEP
jgi:nicotinate-nucleotide pyrophosphorylase (carboxylating)